MQLFTMTTIGTRKEQHTQHTRGRRGDLGQDMVALTRAGCRWLERTNVNTLVLTDDRELIGLVSGFEKVHSFPPQHDNSQQTLHKTMWRTARRTPQSGRSCVSLSLVTRHAGCMPCQVLRCLLPCTASPSRHHAQPNPTQCLWGWLEHRSFVFLQHLKRTVEQAVLEQ